MIPISLTRTTRATMLSCLMLSPLAASAQTAVGVWESYAVMNNAFKVVAKPNYIFTTTRLTEPTVFTALRNPGFVYTLCCMVVKNVTPVVLADVVKKYAVDKEFGDQMKSVKGAPFMYEAVPIEPSAWNEDFKSLMQSFQDPEDGVPGSEAVVGVRLANSSKLKQPFQAGADLISLAVSHPRGQNTARYEFKVNGKRIVVTDAMPPHE